MLSSIPCACITTEDADFFDRMQARNATVTLSLYMEAENVGSVASRNIIGEITGSKYPEQVRRSLYRATDLMLSNVGRWCRRACAS